MSSFDYRALCAKLEQLYRSFGVLPRVIGRTVLGRAVFALDLGAKNSRSLLLTGVSGMEGALSAFSLSFCEQVLRAAQDHVSFCGVDLRRALGDCGITVVPCLNPDGLELQMHGLPSAPALRRFLRPLLQNGTVWHANARGVDLRRQHSVGFAAYTETCAAEQRFSPRAAGYPGERPQSEAETQAICALCRRERFRHALVLQTGEPQLCLHPPADETANAFLGAKLLADAAELPLVPPSPPAGGFADWFSQTSQRPAFTAQTGKGSAPLPEKAWLELLLLSVLL